MKQLYIDVSADYPYDWSLSPSCNEVLRIQCNFAQCEFVANSSARLSKGDLYRIELRDDEAPEFFILKHSFSIVPDKIVENYLANKRK